MKNTGSVAGDEVVELYLSQPKQFETPIRVLASFQRIHLEPGQSAHVSLTVDPRSLGQVDAKGNRVIVPGDYVGVVRWFATRRVGVDSNREVHNHGKG